MKMIELTADESSSSTEVLQRSIVSSMPTSSLAMAMLFGSILFTTAALSMRSILDGDSRAFAAALRPHSSPLEMSSFVSIYTLLFHSATFGMILFFAYICENHPIYPHDEKVYDRDQFFFLIVLLFLFGFYTVHKNGSGIPKKSVTDSVEESSSGALLAKKIEHNRVLVRDTMEDNLNGKSNSSLSTIEDCPRIHRDPSFSNKIPALTTSACIQAKETTSCNDVLNRDQTEEWKGWMQFVFLIYHYYHAEEVYNSIRIMITCYVWMTGFGNFSFFYIKNDFSFVRLVQMLWRLNFLVIFLCLSQGTTYILYYICPLHTYFFLMVYVTMRIGNRYNYSKYGLRLKLATVALAIFLIWDVDLGLFKFIHYPFVGTKPILGAMSGTMWEWYFRTTLDHWSTFLGMIFAANYPIVSLFYRKLEALPPYQCWLGKGVIGLCMAVAFIIWVRGPFMLEKFEYNVTNPYFGFLPLITYIYFRNLTPGLRSYSLKVLHEIGKTTLETYLMQHHIWLASNAKSLLVLVPGWPKINMVVVTIIYFVTSRKLYKLTIFLRGMVLPNDSRRCVQSLLVMACILSFFYSTAYFLHSMDVANLKAIAIISMACGGLLYKAVMDNTWEMYSPKQAHDDTHRTPWCKWTKNNYKIVPLFSILSATMILFAVGMIWQRHAILGAGKIGPLDQNCAKVVNNGHWISIDGCNEATRGMAYRNEAIQSFATCGPDGVGYMWGWEVSKLSVKCRFSQRRAKQLTMTLNHRRIGFIGDSITRNLYHAFSRLLGVKDAGMYDANGPKHSNITRTVDHTDIDFKWAPFASDQVAILTEINDEIKQWDVSSYDLVLVGGGAWDRLHRFGNEDEIESLSSNILKLVEQMITMKKLGIPVVWITPTTINTPALNTPEKRDHMTEEDMSDMRSIYEQLGVTQAASFVVDGPSFSKQRVDESFDGVHYPPDVYSAGAQIFANALDWLLPELEGIQKFVPPEPGKMARPFLGIMMLCLCFIGLFFFDGFFGFSYVACFFIRGIQPQDLYDEAFSILHVKCDLPSLDGADGNSSRTNQSGSAKRRTKTRRKVVTSNMDEEIEPFVGKQIIDNCQNGKANL